MDASAARSPALSGMPSSYRGMPGQDKVDARLGLQATLRAYANTKSVPHSSLPSSGLVTWWGSYCALGQLELGLELTYNNSRKLQMEAYNVRGI